MSSFDLPGWRDRPPAIYAQAFAHLEKANMAPMMLVATTEPVWPQDEDEEIRRIEIAGGKVPKVASLSTAQEIIDKLRIELPDRLFAYLIKQPPSDLVPTNDYEYYVFYVSTTFSAAPGIVPRRMRLQLELHDVHNKPPRHPIAFEMHPGTQVDAELTRLGEFKIDVGAAVKTFFPPMPDVLTAKIGGSIDIKKIQARVQAAGKNTHRPEWRIADAVINYDFNPACIVQVPNGAQLGITANLHVEARRKLLKTYFRTAQSRHYILGKMDGRPIDSDEMTQGSPVTLRQPGVVYADERSLYSYVSGSDKPDDPSPEVLRETNRNADFGPAVRYSAFGPATTDAISDAQALVDDAQARLMAEASPSGSLGDLQAMQVVPFVSAAPGFTSGSSVASSNSRLALTGEYVTVRPADAADIALLATTVTGKGTLVVEGDQNTIGIIEYDEDASWLYHHGRINIHFTSSQRNTSAWVEAIRLVAQYMHERLGHHRVTCEPDVNDAFAIACYTKVGFRSIGRMHQYRRGMDDSFHDAMFMELLTKELRRG